MGLTFCITFDNEFQIAVTSRHAFQERNTAVIAVSTELRGSGWYFSKMMPSTTCCIKRFIATTSSRTVVMANYVCMYIFCRPLIIILFYWPSGLSDRTTNLLQIPPPSLYFKTYSVIDKSLHSQYALGKYCFIFTAVTVRIMLSKSQSFIFFVNMKVWQIVKLYPLTWPKSLLWNPLASNLFLVSMDTSYVISANV